MIERRSFLTGLIALVAAPAIVRAGSLMPVKQMIEPISKSEGIETGLSILCNGGLKIGDVITFGGMNDLHAREFIVTGFGQSGQRFLRPFNA